MTPSREEVLRELEREVDDAIRIRDWGAIGKLLDEVASITPASPDEERRLEALFYRLMGEAFDHANNNKSARAPGAHAIYR